MGRRGPRPTGQAGPGCRAPVLSCRRAELPPPGRRGRSALLLQPGGVAEEGPRLSALQGTAWGAGVPGPLPSVARPSASALSVFSGRNVGRVTPSTEPPHVPIAVCVLPPPLGQVLLHHAWDLPESVHHEGDRGVCGREGLAQAAVLPEAHGAQAEQGGARARARARGPLCGVACSAADDPGPSPQSLSEIILISCENDLHLCREYFARGIGRRGPAGCRVWGGYRGRGTEGAGQGARAGPPHSPLFPQTCTTPSSC